jgi:predicted tellurium resistance membrane protein TerC
MSQEPNHEANTQTSQTPLLQGSVGVVLVVIVMLAMSGALTHTPGLSALLLLGLSLIGASMVLRGEAPMRGLAMFLMIVGGVIALASFLYIQSAHTERKQQRLIQPDKGR